MNENKSLTSSPLSLEEIQLIEATGLPGVERHHLRLLAHCLSCFKDMSNCNNSSGDLPKDNIRLKWCLDQPKFAEDRAFVSVLLEQFDVAAQQLEEIAAYMGVSPLQLNIEDLIKFRLDQ